MKKKYVSLAALFLTAILLCGCGGGANSAASAPAAAAPAMDKAESTLMYTNGMAEEMGWAEPEAPREDGMTGAPSPAPAPRLLKGQSGSTPPGWSWRPRSLTGPPQS